MNVALNYKSHLNSFVHILALYNQFILPNELDKDTDFLKYQFTDLLLRSLGVEQEYAFSDLITAKYFHEDQLGNITAMSAGAIDVNTIKILPLQSENEIKNVLPPFFLF